MKVVSQTRYLYLILFLVCFCSIGSVQAQKDPVYTAYFPGDSIQVGKSLVIQDTVFFNPALKPTILRTNSIQNIVSFRLNEHAGIVLPDTFSIQLKVRLIYRNIDNIQDSITEKVLSIQYSKEKTYKGRSFVVLAGAYELQVKILEIIANATVLEQIRPALLLENKIHINRDYTMNPMNGQVMDCTDNAIRQVLNDPSSVSEYGELKISWIPNPVIEWYDVEWTYIDSSALASGKYSLNGEIQPTTLFKNNSTRIRTSADTCMIPLLYDGKGTLFYRVRGVQIDPAGELITTSWSSDFTSEGGLGEFEFTGHERKLNWQATTSFAEEAKRKSVVQYFDGSLRNRQTVTRDNTTDSTIIAETLYDKQGRPVIQVLPAPSLTKLIQYTPGFNVHHLNGSEYDKRIYDTLLTAADYCAPFTDSMGSSSGASRYYSSNNPLKEHLNHQFIPDAKGYAFTETQYAQDNTGRINRQGGVGRDFQIGSGHETRYYYANPEQTDLDALFGTEAGDANHYQKNMVRDANGQYSVSYVDMHGRTVATALAGAPPIGIDTLISYRDSFQTEKIVTPTNNIKAGATVQATKSLIVTREGLHEFTYTMGADTLTLADCQQRNICYDCLYDLTITITDDCNNQLLGGEPLVITKSNFKLFEIDTVCGLVHPLDTSFSISLQPGVYNITKKLSISEAAMSYYRDSIYMAANTCINYDSLYSTQLALVRNDMSCNPSSEAIAEYQTYRKDMLMDLYPLIGQYADTATVDEKGELITNRCFSIFNNGFNSYRKSTLKYVDENGQPALVQNQAGVLVKPQELTVDEFIDNFQASWAETLLEIHPEFRALNLYESYSASHLWEEDFVKTDTYAEAKAKGYLNPTGSTNSMVLAKFPIVNPDPLFSAYSHSMSTKVAFEAILVGFTQVSGTNVSLWGLTTAMAKCPNEYTTDPSCVLQWNQSANFYNETSLCEGELDMAWRAFRSQYLTLKKDWIVSRIKAQPEYQQIKDPCFAHFADGNDLLAKEGYGTDTSSYRAQAASATAALYEDNCKAFASTWWTKLQSACNYYAPEDSSIIISYLVQVCKEGADLEHPFGSSSVKPGSTYRFKNFDEVIKFYNDSTGRSTTIDCNSYLLEQPLPYKNSAPVVNQTIYSKPDDCACDQVNLYYNQYQSVSGEYASFSQFLAQKYQTKVSQGTLDSLRMLCNDIGEGCKYIPKPLSLPPLFNCQTQEVCVPCEKITSLYDDFKTEFPGITPTYLENDTTQQKVNRIFSSYLNNKLGFSFSHLDYLEFIDSCATDSLSAPDSFSWSDTTAVKLHKLLDDFQYHFISKTDKFANQGNNGQALWGVGGLINNVRPITDANERGILNVIDSGRIKMPYPDSTVRWGSINYNNARFTKVYNEYAFEARVKNPGGGGLTFFVGNKSTNDSSVSLDEDYSVAFVQTSLNGYTTHRGVRIYDSTFGSKVSFADWRVIKMQVTLDSFKVFIDGVQVKSFVRDYKSYISHLSGCYTIASSGRTLEMDWFRLYRGNDTLVHEETFNDYPKIKVPDPKFFLPLDCREEFTEFYNSRNGTSLTINQIDSIYLNKFGRIPNYCDSSDCGIGFSENVSLHTDSLLNTFANLTFHASATTLEGGYVYAGTSYVSDSLGTFENQFLIKKNAKGIPVWSKSYSDSLPIFSKLIQTKDGGYLSLNGANPFSDSYITKFDKSGNIVWSTNVGTELREKAKLIETLTGRFVLVGYENSVEGFPFVRYFELNKNGQLLQQYRYEIQKSTFNEQYFLNFLDAVEKKDSIIVIGSLESSGVQAGNPVNDGVGFLFAINKKSGQSSTLREYRGNREVTGFKEIVPSKNGFKISTYAYGKLTGNPSSSTSGWIGITSITENGIVTNSKQLYSAQGFVDPSHVITSDEDSTLFTAFLLDSNLYVQNHHPVSGWNSVIDIREVTSAPVTASNNGMFTPFAALPPEYAISGIKKKFNRKGLLIDAFNNEQNGGYNYLVLAESGKLNCGWAPYTPDSGSYNLSVVHLSINKDTLTLPGTITGFGYRPEVVIKSERKCTPISCEAPRGRMLCGKSTALNEPMEFVQEDPCSDSTSIATMLASELFRIKRDSLLGHFEAAYLQKCLTAINLEQFTVRHPVSEYHYTLYYYDLAGNLVKTVPPAGVQPNRSEVWLAEVAQKRALGQYQAPEHQLVTIYRYNSLNQVVSQYTPDGGSSSFWYDRLGRLSISQNAQQAADQKYSYTAYDVIGRITEVGQKPNTIAMTNQLSRNPVSLQNWLQSTFTTPNNDQALAEQVTKTVYDAIDPILDPEAEFGLVIPVNQKPYTLRNRVSYTRTYDYLLANPDGSPVTGLFDHSTTYSYDIHGNVDTLLQQYRSGIMGVHGDNRFKVLAYKYDLISGKVNQVHFQPGQPDQLYHRYEYDADNRLTDVYTTDHKLLIGDRDLEEHDAHYDYYQHGPLARTVLGHQQVQGLDYAYTLQGWLKGVNSMGLTASLDMGEDGNPFSLVARDAIGFQLNYFSGDYTAINTKNPFPGHSGFLPNGEYRPLYNGNISSMGVNIGRLNQPQLYNYKYDQLNRLTRMDTYRGFNTSANNWNGLTATEDYKERIRYDGNGNILGYLRNGTTVDGGALQMDSLTYHYFVDANGIKRNNRLRVVADGVGSTNYSVDLDNQVSRLANAADSNYVYDAIGNLIQDKTENITNIRWSVYGKILEIEKAAVNAVDVSKISYTYDAAGNRIGKRVQYQGKPDQYTWYSRDASGNVMAVYEYTGSNLNTDTLWLREQHLYGSSRIGIWNRKINMDQPVPAGTSINLLGTVQDGTFERGKKFFELSNHLGNVLATVSDKKAGVDTNADGILDYFQAEVVSASDYYPFGMLMPGRQVGMGLNIPGGEVTGTTEVNGYEVPVDLVLSSRTGVEPNEYVASNTIEISGEFESGETDEFSAYIADETYAGTGNQYTGGGMYGTAGLYRYGFNSKENDNEVKGTGDQVDFGSRIYDTRLGRFFSTDKYEQYFPGQTPYSFATNNPILLIDNNGEAPVLPPLYNAFHFIKNLTTSHPLTVYGFQQAKNTSLSHLQKAAWYSGQLSSFDPRFHNVSTNWNTLYGVCGEIEMMERFYSEIAPNQFLHSPTENFLRSEELTKQIQVAHRSLKFNFEPDAKTDYTIEFNAQVGYEKVPFIIGFDNIRSNIFGSFLHKQGKPKAFYNNAVFVHEVKTVSPDNPDLFKIIERGVDQLLTNPLVSKEGGIPVLVIDTKAAEKAIKIDVTRFSKLINKLKEAGGGLATENNLNTDASNRLNSVIKTIRTSTEAPKSGYYNNTNALDLNNDKEGQ